MVFGIFGSVLILAMFLRPSVVFPLEPNTDAFFVIEFMQEMGLNLNPSQQNWFYGPLCSRKGVYCDPNGDKVVKLELSAFGLSGAIPANTIGQLTELETLDLSNNNITALPYDLWSLGSLKNLNLSLNQISGMVPSNIGNLVRLETLDLSFNSFYGGIPEAISSIVSLKALILNNNGFDSVIPSGLFQCEALMFIDISSNKLDGPLPSGFGSAFPELRFLNLAGNRILGRALDLSGLGSIRFLNISGNWFRGSVDGVFEGPLEVVDLSRNQFQGLMAQVSSNSTFNWSNLVYLDVSENQFCGVFSTHLSLGLNLKHLNLAHNRFSKQPFLGVDTFSRLEYLNLSKTNIVDSIPSNISNLSSLAILDLSHNHLTNRIPRVLAMNLEVLDLSYNNLSGDIPYVLLQELEKMEMINFSYNNLSYCAPQFSDLAPFIGLRKSCPIAADSSFFRKDTPKHKGIKLALILTLSMTSLLVGVLFAAFGCRQKPAMWVAKQNHPRNEEQVITGPFSFQTGSTTWVADIRQATSVPVVIFHKPLLNFTFADLLSATSNFDRATLLAEGRFGPVYGGLLPGGIHVAIKVLVRGSGLSDQEAARELEYLGRIKHHNLVPLAGYCLAGHQRIAIYDYMENGNLENLLHDLPLGFQTTEDWSSEIWEEENYGVRNVGPLTTWRFRHKIALGTARALAFLHHGCSPPIIHRDVKASSVYLDSMLEPRLSDFGLAKIVRNGLEEEIARGSPGYVPPEFLQSSSTRAPTPKSDVYGFGVILFELITGKKPIEDDYPDENEVDLVSWVRGLVRMNQGSRVIDPKIRGTGPDEKMVEALRIGYLCTAEIPSKRPTMHQVVGLLKDLEPFAQQETISIV